MHAKDAAFVLHSNYAEQNTGHLNNSNYEALLAITCIYKKQVLVANTFLSSSKSQKIFFLHHMVIKFISNLLDSHFKYWLYQDICQEITNTSFAKNK